MNCDEAEVALGAYALDALPEEERAALRAHLATCERHARAAQRLRATASQLALTVEESAPPGRLRAAVLEGVARTPQERPPASDRAPLVRFARRRWPAPLAWASAAAAALVIAGLLAWNVVLQNRDDGGLDELVRGATEVVPFDSTAGDASGLIVYFEDRREVMIVASGLHRLDPGAATYQVWAIGEGGPESIGLFQASDRGDSVAVVPFDAARTATLAVTVEPPGGSPAPTTDPVIVAEI